MRNTFRHFNSSPDVTRRAVMMCIRYPLSLRQVEDPLFERGIDICHETVRLHAPIHNDFNQDLHLNRRDIFKQNRSAALADWCQLAASGAPLCSTLETGSH